MKSQTMTDIRKTFKRTPLSTSEYRITPFMKEHSSEYSDSVIKVRHLNKITNAKYLSNCSWDFHQIFRVFGGYPYDTLCKIWRGSAPNFWKKGGKVETLTLHISKMGGRGLDVFVQFGAFECSKIKP